MRSSARSIDRLRGGFTLLEVVIAVTIFSIVVVVALSQIIEATDSTRYATVRADLRRQGELVLAEIVQNMRSTDSFLAGADSNANENALDLVKVQGFDATNNVPILATNKDGTGAGVDYDATTPQIPATALLIKYSQPNASCLGGLGSPGPDAKVQGYLLKYYAPLSSFPPTTGSLPNPQLASGFATTTLTQELALKGDTMPTPAGNVTVDGFSVSTGSALPGLLSASPRNVNGFGNQPTALTIKLVLKRRVEKTGTDLGQYAWTTVQTTVMLRPDQRY